MNKQSIATLTTLQSHIYNMRAHTHRQLFCLTFLSCSLHLIFVALPSNGKRNGTKKIHCWKIWLWSLFIGLCGHLRRASTQFMFDLVVKVLPRKWYNGFVSIDETTAYWWTDSILFCFFDRHVSHFFWMNWYTRIHEFLFKILPLSFHVSLAFICWQWLSFLLVSENWKNTVEWK